jgi:small subunit ribosomal protein S9
MDIPALVEDQEFYAGVGRRKTASAQVRLYATGEGQVIVNGKPLEEYFTRMRDRVHVMEPLQATGTENAFTITILVRGGGVTGQAGAVRHGIARALLKYDENLRPTLRRGGFLTRDPRMKERKKPGLKRARKAPQYTKR